MERLRVLLLSRRGDDLWGLEIDRADAYDLFDEGALEVGPLPVGDLHAIFQEARGNVPVGEGVARPAEVTEEAFAEWLRGETAHRRPLFVLAAAIESALEPDRPVVRLSGREVIRALARPELTRLREALSAVEEAVEIRRRLASSNPARYEPDLAGSLHNLSLHLSAAGREPEAVEAQREAAALIEPYARRVPDGHHGRWGETIRRRLEALEAGEAAG